MEIFQHTGFGHYLLGRCTHISEIRYPDLTFIFQTQHLGNPHGSVAEQDTAFHCFECFQDFCTFLSILYQLQRVTSSFHSLITRSPSWIWMDRGRQKDPEAFPAGTLTAPKKCPWINAGLDALSDSCTIFFMQGIYRPSEARFTPSPMRTVRPDICLKGAYLETVFVHLVKISSQSQESAWKKCSMQLYKEGFRSRSLIIEVMPRESERTINPVMIAADHSNAAFLEKQGRKHNSISLINLSIWYFPSAGIYVIVRVR